MRILLLEDDAEVGKFVKKGLLDENFAVDLVDTGEKGLMLAKVNDYDLGVFDIKLAGRETGVQVCRAIRSYGKDFPVIMLSATGEIVRKIEALDMGADDYLQKPFFFAELSARVRALMRRERKIVGPVLVLGDLTLDVRKRTAARAGKELALNRKEFMLLEYLMRNPGTVLTRMMILEHVWDMNADPFTNTVDVHVRFLRRKVDEPFKERLIKTVHGYGYKIEA